VKEGKNPKIYKENKWNIRKKGGKSFI